MKTITIELPEKVASLFESLSVLKKTQAALIGATVMNAPSKSLSDLFDKIDSNIAESGLSQSEIDELLKDIS